MDLTNKIHIISHTDKGMVREHNEDYVGSNINQGLIILADGMGGYNAGEVASEMTVNTVLNEFKHKYDSLPPSSEEEPYSPESVFLRDSIELANQHVFQSSKNNVAHSGMGTTIVSAVFYDNKISIAHLGDSRLYRFRSNELEQITQDHSLIQELIEKGFYTVEEARNSKQKNIITRALGIAESVDVELYEDIVLVDDIYLLCSDGLNDMLEPQEIASIIKENTNDTYKAAELLIQGANNMGGNDNVSVILVKVEAPFPAKTRRFNWLSNWF